MTTARQPLGAHEWNFNDVPHDQLEACYLYEYAREFFKSSNHLQEFQKEWNDPAKKQIGENYMAWKKAYDLLKTRCENFPSINFDYFPKMTWLDLPVLPKTARRGFQIDIRQDAADSVNEWSAQHRKGHSDRLHIETLRQCEPPNIRTVEAFKAYHYCSHRQPDLGETEYGFFAINWSYRDPEIKRAFNEWLQEQREERRELGHAECQPQSNRGGFKDKLRWLGALRVIEFYKKRYRRKEWVSYPDQMVEMHVKAPYSYYPDLSEAANKAKQEMARLFPKDWSEAEWQRKQEEKEKRHPQMLEWMKEHLPPIDAPPSPGEGVRLKV